MLCIISPAKSLASGVGALSLPVSQTIPAFLTKTNALAHEMKKLKPGDFKRLMGVSDAIASRTRDEYAQWQATPALFTDSDTSTDVFAQAGLLFDGPAYRGLDCISLDEGEALACQTHVR